MSAIRNDIIENAKVSITQDDPSVPIFKVPCSFKGKKKCSLLLDCTREGANAVVVVDKKGKVLDEIPAANISLLIVKPNRKRVQFYVEEAGKMKASRKKLKGKAKTQFDSDEEDSDDDSDPKKRKFSFSTPTGAYFAGYLIKFLCRVAKEEDLDNAADNVTLFMGTWNVGNTPPDNDNFGPWIPVGEFDIYVIGGQEAEYDPRKGFSSCGEDWFDAVSSHIGDGYTAISSASMWEIRLLIFVRDELLGNISSVDRTSEATGIGSVMGNKGGVCISFMYNNTSFCFVNSHLAAHQEKISARNEDVQEIIDSITMADKVKDISTQFNHIFWCGDLNYRIERSREDVIAIVSEGKQTELLEYDQLLIEKAKNEVFYGFTEGDITFRPTYKFDNHQPHDYYSEERNRVPAWCDRILWSSWDQYKGDVDLLEYGAAFEVITSDHSPVYGKFNIRTDTPSIPASLSPEQCIITLTNLRGTDLLSVDSNGLSDPYIIFAAPFLYNSEKTPKIKKTLNPVFEGEEINLAPIYCDRNFLSREHILVKVMDWDKVGGDDLIGRGTLGLDGRLDGNVDFSIEIRKHGLPAGVISGTIEFTWF